MDDRQLARFMEKITVSETGCWEWTAYRKPNGYAQFFLYKIAGSPVHGYGHRVSYEHFIGSIPRELELDHLCRNRACVNPDHLEAVTRRENIRRSTSLKTTCPNGHSYSGTNIRGERICRTCVNERQRTPEARAKHAAYERERRRRKREARS